MSKKSRVSNKSLCTIIQTVEHIKTESGGIHVQYITMIKNR